jgi:hypothetical protein
MAPLQPSVIRAVRNYEPVFRSMLIRWLEAYADATGNKRFTTDDVSAGVAHTFSAVQNGIEIDLGSIAEAEKDIAEGRVLTIAEAKRELCGQAAA